MAGASSGLSSPRWRKLTRQCWGAAVFAAGPAEASLQVCGIALTDEETLSERATIGTGMLFWAAAPLARLWLLHDINIPTAVL